MASFGLRETGPREVQECWDLARAAWGSRKAFSLAVALRDDSGPPGAGALSTADGCSGRRARPQFAGPGRSFGHGFDGRRGLGGCGGLRGRLLLGAYPSRVGVALRARLRGRVLRVRGRLWKLG